MAGIVLRTVGSTGEADPIYALPTRKVRGEVDSMFEIARESTSGERDRERREVFYQEVRRW